MNDPKNLVTLISVPVATVTPLIVFNKLTNSPDLDNTSLFYNLLLSSFSVLVNSEIDTKKDLVNYAGSLAGGYNAWFLYTKSNDNKLRNAVLGAVGGYLVASTVTKEMHNMFKVPDDKKHKKVSPTPHHKHNNLKIVKHNNKLKIKQDIRRIEHRINRSFRF